MKNKNLVFFLVLCSFSVKSESARILAVVPVPVLSHQLVFRVLTQELAKRGHHVTVVTALPAFAKDEAPVNYREIDIHQITDDMIKNLLTEDMKISEDPVSQFVSTYKGSFHITKELLGLKDIQNLIQDKSTYFDVIFLEDCIKSILIFSHLFKAPVIQISSFGGSFQTFESAGAMTHPLLYPLAIRQRYYNLSVWEKISELFLNYRLKNIFYESELRENEVLKNYFGINTPTISELRKNVHMVFLNIHPIWDSNRPVPSNVIYLGGLHQKPQEELPEEWKYFLDSSINGIIYVSFGTNINPALLSPEKVQLLINVFAKIPYDIYWKWNDEKLVGLTKNIKILKWFPQSELLRHPKVKLFITQGGLQSTDEAIAGGVPLIGIPMLWDQWYNVEKYVQLGIGLKLDINTITETQLEEAVKTVIKDKRYKDNIIKLRSVVRDHVQSPLERAVWWTEYVIRHNGSGHLRAPTANMTWVDYYEVKLIFIITISFLLVLITLFLLLRMLRLLRNKLKSD